MISRSLTLAFAVLIALGAPLQAAEIDTVEVVYQNVPRDQVFDGTVEAVQETTVSAQTSGRVIEAFYDVDDFVEKGALLIRFSDTEQKARLDKASAGLVEAQARYLEAQTEFDRIKDIYEKKLVSKSQYDKAEASFKAARAKLNASRASKEEAQIQYDYTQVRAPYSGIVTKRHVEVGEAANVGAPLMTGISLDFLRVLVHVPQQSISTIREFRQASVLVRDAQEPVEAERITLFPYADPQTNTFRVRVYLAEGTEGLFPGMFVKTRFRVGVKQRLVVPANSVVHRSEVTGVYVVRPDQTVSLRQVRLGRKTQDGKAEILAGLDAGERVAVNPDQAILVFKRAGAQGAAHE
jgi:RND family efflux transporter MFP subunit